jgi:hypothetical protein
MVGCFLQVVEQAKRQLMKQVLQQEEQQLITVAHDFLRLQRASCVLEAVLSRRSTWLERAHFLGIPTG